MRHYLSFSDFCGAEVHGLLDRADRLHDLWHRQQMPRTLEGRRIALWFLGQGFRNRLAFETGARSLGAEVSFVPGELGVHEPLEDAGSYLSLWFDLLVVRCASLSQLQTLAQGARIPVINARTSSNHPCEILGDLQYVRRVRGSLDGLKVVFVGEVTNLANSWFEAARVLPVEVVQVGPPECLVDSGTLAALNRGAVGRVQVSADLEGTLGPQVDVLYTDCWPRSGDPGEVRDRFMPYQVSGALVGRISASGFYLPCPPVTRGQEVSEDSLRDPRFQNFQAKEFLLHAQNALMESCVLGGVPG